jgi:hypothetical protein
MKCLPSHLTGSISAAGLPAAENPLVALRAGHPRLLFIADSLVAIVQAAPADPDAWRN